jgi:hypothetical protein
MANPFSMVPTGAPNTTWGGGALGGIAQMGLSAFRGFQQGQQYLDWWRQVQNQRMLDQFAVPAQAAEMQASFQKNALAAQLSKQEYIAMAAKLKERVNPQGAMAMDGQQPAQPAPQTQQAPVANGWPRLNPTPSPQPMGFDPSRISPYFGLGQ